MLRQRLLISVRGKLHTSTITTTSAISLTSTSTTSRRRFSLCTTTVAISSSSSHALRRRWRQGPSPRRWCPPLLPLPLPLPQRRFLIPPPRHGDAMVERRADRDLPDPKDIGYKWRRTLPWFILTMIVSALVIINYQRSSSSVVESVLYALRTSPRAREVLGDNIYFKHRYPWIWGEIMQRLGRYDFSFAVSGSRSAAVVHFASRRRRIRFVTAAPSSHEDLLKGAANAGVTLGSDNVDGGDDDDDDDEPFVYAYYETSKWGLATDDGEWIDLLETGTDPLRGDPFGSDIPDKQLPPSVDPTPRGFRQSNNSSAKK